MTTGPRIYKAGDFLCLVFDPLPGNSKVHSVSLPITKRGLEALIQLLSERERSPFVDKAHIATKEAPIQYMVDEWMRKGGKVTTPKRNAPQTLTLEDLDL